MRFAFIALALLLMSGCSALVMGSAGAGAPHQIGRDRTAIASDSAITSRIKASYDADATIDPFNISVRTYNGVVTLTGTVSSYLPREQAGKIASATEGVAAVNNQIAVGGK